MAALLVTLPTCFGSMSCVRCLRWAVARGYDLWALLDDWLIADSSEALVIRILDVRDLNYSSLHNVTKMERPCFQPTV